MIAEWLKAKALGQARIRRVKPKFSLDSGMVWNRLGYEARDRSTKNPRQFDSSDSESESDPDPYLVECLQRYS